MKETCTSWSRSTSRTDEIGVNGATDAAADGGVAGYYVVVWKKRRSVLCVELGCQKSFYSL